MLYGPSGCGKTMIASAIANEAKLNFISVKGSEFNKYVDEPEKAIRELFERANKLKPCIIFFDEFDSVSSRKSVTGIDVTARVIDTLKVKIADHASRLRFMLAATNRPHLIDRSILRRGRFDKAIYIGIPNAKERVDILKTITKNGKLPKCSADVDFDQIGSNASLDGYSGADLTETIRRASLSALERFMPRKESGEQLDLNEAVMEKQDFVLQLKKIRPSVSKQQRRKYDEMLFEFESMRM